MSDNVNSELLLIDEFTVGPRIFDYQMKTGLVEWSLKKFFHRLTFSTPKGRTFVLSDSEVDQFKCLWKLCSLYNEQERWLNERNISKVVIGFIPGIQIDRCLWKSGYHPVFIGHDFDLKYSEYGNPDSFIIDVENQDLSSVLDTLFPVNNEITRSEPNFTEADFPAMDSASNIEVTATKAPVTEATKVTKTNTKTTRSWAEEESDSEDDAEDEDEIEVQQPPIGGGGKSEIKSKKIEIRPETPSTTLTDPETVDFCATPKESDLLRQIIGMKPREIAALKTKMFDVSKTELETFLDKLSKLKIGADEALQE